MLGFLKAAVHVGAGRCVQEQGSGCPGGASPGRADQVRSDAAGTTSSSLASKVECYKLNYELVDNY